MTDENLPPRARPGAPDGTDGPRARVLGGRYEMGKVIGRGGMAVVSLARDTRLGRDVAVKELRVDLASDPTFQARFRREAQAAAGLNHPNIVSVYDTGEEPDPHGRVQVPFIVMELVEGRTLRDILREGRPILPRRALEFTQGVLDALGYSHKAGIVHRDIKPANVMLTSSGAIKVMDFGIARAVADTSATMTQTAAVIGTAQYLSPEQARGETVDARSDIYSAGCLLYELLVGRPPFQGDSPVSVAYQHVREQPVPPSQLDAEITAPMDAVTLRALAKNPDDRYQTAAEMREDIGRILGGQRVEATLPPPVPPLLAPVAASAATAVLPAETAGAAALAGGDSPPTWGGTLGTAGMAPVPPAPRRNRALWWTLGLLVLAFAVFLVTYLVELRPGANGPQLVQVPAGLLTQPRAAAEEMVRTANLEPAIATVQGDDDSTLNKVVAVSPRSGQLVEVGSIVTLTINVGPEKKAIPAGLEGLPYEEAREILTDAGFLNVRPVDATESNEPKDADPGTVVSVSPAAGQEVPTEDVVTVTVATGKARVPYLLGLTEEAARAEAGKYGFTEFEVEQQPSTQTPGTVIATRPLQDTLYPKTDTVVLILAQEPEPEPTPTPTTTPTPPPTSEPPAPTPTTSATPTAEPTP